MGSIFILILDGDQWSASRHGPLALGEEKRYALVTTLAESRSLSGHCVEEKMSALVKNRIPSPARASHILATINTNLFRSYYAVPLLNDDN
jgi:hypothetical protein